MTNQEQAVFIDLPNFYSQLIRSKLETPKFLREYFLVWLDFDILAETLAKNSPINVWIFYSGERLGPSDARIDGKYLEKYIKRVNRLVGTTAYNVNIPGEQREPLKLVCPSCGKNTDTEWKSEKGIDASLTVHLFDTMESWRVAYLFSGDADFVPAVKSLRRRGKVVIGAGILESASSALIRECYNYIDLHEGFFKTDFILYRLFQKNGLIYKWFNEVQPDNGARAGTSSCELSHSETEDDHFCITFTTSGFFDLKSWEQELLSFKGTFQTFSNNRNAGIMKYKFCFHRLHIKTVSRKFAAFVESLESIKDVKHHEKLKMSPHRFHYTRQFS